MNGHKPANKSSAPPTLVEIHHPEFRKGYHDGRLYSFQQHVVITDKYIVDLLHEPFCQALLDKEGDIEDTLYYAVGHVIGEMSVHVLPYQPHEGRTDALREQFMKSVVEKYGEAGAASIDAIRQFWTMRDRLAHMLDVDTFEEMLQRGAAVGS